MDPLRPFLGGPNRVVRVKGKGRAVIATREYKPGQLIEKSHVIVFPRREIDIDGKIGFYVYEWTRSTYAMAFGQGPLYNHSFEPNARYYMDHKAQVIRYYAHRTIRPGEEITTNYLFDPRARGDVGFDLV